MSNTHNMMFGKLKEDTLRSGMCRW